MSSAAERPGSSTASACHARAASARDRKSTRLNSSHTEIYTLSLHDALPISRQEHVGHGARHHVERRRASGIEHGERVPRQGGEREGEPRAAGIRRVVLARTRAHRVTLASRRAAVHRYTTQEALRATSLNGAGALAPSGARK